MPADRPRRRRAQALLLVFLLVLVGGLGLVLVGRWLNATKRGGQQPAEPFRIAGNFYYVGANDVTAFLLTGPEGHIVLDGGYPSTAPMIMASIAKLGFDIKDVKILLNSEPHPDHAGGLANAARAETVAVDRRFSAERPSALESSIHSRVQARTRWGARLDSGSVRQQVQLIGSEDSPCV